MFVASDTCFPVTVAERRRATRRRPARETIARLRAADGADLGTGLVWNLSTSGVSLLYHQPLEPGTWLTIELVGAAAQEPLQLGLRVVHRGTLLTGDYVLGGQFERGLAEEELEPFVL